MRSPNAVWLVVLLLALWAPVTEPSGVLTHASIGTRALRNFGNSEYSVIGLRNSDAFQCGTAFPDWGYNLGIDPLHDASEEAHWPPFFYHFAGRISRAYPQPWTAAGSRVAAFALGALAHSVTDVLWHNLADAHALTGQGLIKAQAEIFFNGTFSKSHTAADVGGEFVTAAMASTAWFNTSWFYPTEDILSAYGAMGITVPEESLRAGMSQLWLEVELVKLVWRYAMSLEAVSSPFMQEEMLSYFVGGAQDSAQWTSRCWPTFISWLEHGPDTRRLCSILPVTTTTPSLARKNAHRHGTRAMQAFLAKVPEFAHLSSLVKPFVQIKTLRHEGGDFISFNRPLEHIASAVGPELLRKTVTSIANLVRSGGDSASSTSRIDKETLNNVNNLSEKSRQVRAAPCTSTGQLPNILTLSSDVYYANLGESMATGDFNGDGIMELAIGAPGHTPINGLQDAGAVYILDVLSRVTGKQSFLINGPSSNAHKLSGTIAGSRFGSAVVTVDLNRDGIDDLVVSEPRYGSHLAEYSGRLFVYYGTHSGLSTSALSIILPANGGGNFTMLGSSLSSGDIDGDGFADLIIGAPYACNVKGKCDHKSPQAPLQSGAVIVFTSSSWASNPVVSLSSATYTLSGSQRYTWLGMRVQHFRRPSDNSSQLVVSSPLGGHTPTIPAPGAVSSFNWQELVSGSSSASPAKITSSASSAKLGWSLAVGSPRSTTRKAEILATGAPSATTQSWSSFSGQVFLTPTSSLQAGSSINTGTLLSISGTEDLGRFGWSVAMADLDGDKFDELIVSAPFEASQAGRIYVWDGGEGFPTTSTTTASRSMCFEASEERDPATRSRLGHALLPLSRTRNGVTNLLAVSSPLQSSARLEGGAVYIINFL